MYGGTSGSRWCTRIGPVLVIVGTRLRSSTLGKLPRPVCRWLVSWERLDWVTVRLNRADLREVPLVVRVRVNTARLRGCTIKMRVARAPDACWQTPPPCCSVDPVSR